MGLQMTLPKDKNHLYYEFKDAYWAIDNVIYSLGLIDFSLKCFPNRESKLMNNEILSNPSIGIGSSRLNTVDSSIYEWHVRMDLTEIFPDGSIPAGKDAQYTAIYNWIKEYTELPFVDVFEE